MHPWLLTLLGLAASEPPPGPPPDISGDADGTVSFAAVGHVVLATDHPALEEYLPPDGLALAARVAPLLGDADLKIANLAAPFTTVERARHAQDGVGVFAFRTPPSYVPTLKALGFDVVLSTNNHQLDFGRVGHVDTLAYLDRADIGYVGHVGEVWTRVVHGVRVAVVGFGIPHEPDWQSSWNIPAAGEVVARAALEADVVIALVHGGGEGKSALHVPRGGEYVGIEYRGRMVDLCRHLVTRGADLVLGFGAHAPRAMEVYDGRLIAYALGNFLVYGPFDMFYPNHLGIVLEVTLDRRGEFVAGHVTPLRLRKPGVPGLDPGGQAIRYLRNYSRADFPGSAPIIDPDGTLRIPARADAASP